MTAKQKKIDCRSKEGVITENISYEPIIDKMVWSYSRVKSFEDCPYKWYLRYIKKLHSKSGFFAEYGSFMHKLIELFLSGEKTRKQVCDMYIKDFKKEVKGRAPNPKIFKSYFSDGIQYLRTMEPPPLKIVAVEKKVEFEIDGLPFIGYIDLLGENINGYYIIDHKSRKLKQRSRRAKPTKDDETLNEYLRQLYLYSSATFEEYGKFPLALCFNCFRTNSLIREPFDAEKYEEARKWLIESVKNIRQETEFRPNLEYFKCTNLCEMNDHCDYYKMNFKKK